MTFFLSSSLRVRLLLLVVLAVLPMLGLMLHFASEGSNREIERHQEDTLKSARFIALDQERLIQGVHHVLVNMARLSAVKELDPTTCSALFASQLKLFPIFTNFALADLDGNLFCSGIPLDEPINIAGRPWFQNAAQSRDSMASDYDFNGYLSHEPVIAFGYPVLDEAGQIRAILCAKLKLRSWLAEAIGKMQLPNSTILTIFDQSGTILAHHPNSDRWVGHSMGHSLFMRFTAAHTGGRLEASNMEGIPCYFGLAQLPHTFREAYITVGFPKSNVLAHVNRSLTLHIGLLLAATALMFIIAVVSADLLLIRRVKALLSTTKRLAEGDLTARTGLRYGHSEMSQLARTFDQMADNLERRQIESEQLEEVLRDSGRRFRAIFNQAFQFTAVLDPPGRLLEANQAILDFGGLRNAKVYSQPFWETPWWSHSLQAQRDLKEAIDRANRGELVRYEVELQGAEGKTAIVDFSLKPLKDENGRVTLLIAEGRDVTERKHAEEILRESEKELRMLSSRLLTAQEDERKRIARELHDSIGQSLSAVKFGVENSLRQILETRPDTDTQSLEALVPIVQCAIDEVRKIMTDLRPSLLDDLGIMATLEWFCREFRKVYSRIHIEKEFDIQEYEMPEPLKIVIFRVVQEALNNIAKHSKASFVDLSLSKTDRVIELIIEDDGMGFDQASVSERIDFKGGYGLSSMKERTELSGGRFSIESTMGEGTVIRASWPCVPMG